MPPSPPPEPVSAPEPLPALEPLSAPEPPQALRAWIKTDCGRAKYVALAGRPGVAARLRLGWFVLIAALRDLPLPPPDRDRDAAAERP